MGKPHSILLETNNNRWEQRWLNDENIDEDDSDERNDSLATTTPDFESNSSNENTQQTSTSSQPLTSTQISENNDKNENQSNATETNILLIGNRKRKNPIEDDPVMYKQVKRCGRPTAEQVKQKENL